MDLANEVAQYLADSGFGTLGTDIYTAFLPDDKNGIYVSPLGGQLGNYTPINETALDIFVVNESGRIAATTINQIKRHIHRMHTTETDNAFIYSILVVGDVQNLERNLEYRKTYKITVSVLNRDTALIS